MPAPTFTVIYRTGGTLNAQWIRTLVSTSSPAEAQVHADEIINGGRAAVVVSTATLEKVGMPSGWEFSGWLEKANLRNGHLLNVACPECGASAGERCCIGADRTEVVDFHASRFNAWWTLNWEQVTSNA